MISEIIQENFAGGEFSPTLFGRVDIAQYENACESIQNFLIRPQGNLISCPGTEFINDAKNSGPNNRDDGGGIDDDTLLLLHFDGNLVDSSQYSRANSSSTGIGYSTGVFDQSGTWESSNLSPDNDLYNINFTGNEELAPKYAGREEYTVDFRFKLTSDDESDFNFIKFWGIGNPGAGTEVFSMYYHPADDSLRYYNKSGVISAEVSVSNSGISLNTWYHIVYTISHSTIKIFKDGTNVLTDTVASNSIPTFPTDVGNFQVGLESNPAENHLEYQFDEFRVSNGLRWTTDFTPPTVPYSNASNFRARLIQFIFSRSDSYIIEMGVGYFRFYTNGGVVEA